MITLIEKILKKSPNKNNTDSQGLRIEPSSKDRLNFIESVVIRIIKIFIIEASCTSLYVHQGIHLEQFGWAIMSELYSENLNRFNAIVESLPLKLRINISSLCLLDNVSTQMLRLLLLSSTSPHVIELISDPTAYLSTGETETFQTLLKLFTHIRMIYNSKTPLLTVNDVAPGLWHPNSAAPLILRGHEAYIITTIRKSNLLTFLLTILNCFDYGFEFLQESFLDLFCPNTVFTGNAGIDQNGKFLKSQALLYLDLKTQAFISALGKFENRHDKIVEVKREELLYVIFSNNLADELVLRRIGNRHIFSETVLTPSEREFVERCERRRENLLCYSSLKKLIHDYDWDHFVKELLDYCNKNLGLIIWGRRGRGKSPLYCFDSEEFDKQALYASGAAAVTTDESVSHQNLLSDELGPGSFESTDLTSNVARNAIWSSDSGSNSGTNGNDKEFGDKIYKNTTKEAHADRLSQTLADAAVIASKDLTSVGAGANAGNRAVIGSALLKKSNSKRTWSKEEQEALAEGLRGVGPSWAKILDLYGPGGKINESLKNRSQVQLKDKARNWKLQYLKSGRPLPVYLLKVTGTLERTFRSKKKLRSIQPHNNNHSIAEGADNTRDSITASGMCRPSADNSGFDPNLEADM